MTSGKRAAANPFGMAEALFGLVVGFGLSILGVSAYAALEHVRAGSPTVGEDVVSLVTLWVGFVGAAVLASRHAAHTGGGAPPDGAGPADPEAPERLGSASLARDFGLRLRPWPDVPIGLVVGVAGQFLLVPLLELPLAPFVHHLNQRLGHPTKQLLGPATSAGSASLVLVAVLICVGSPIVEELFFRGLVLRALLWQFRSLGGGGAVAASVVATGLVFGLVHFETLQFLGLAGFGMVLGVLAWRTGRLGASIVAHMAFNASTVIAYVFVH